MSYEDAILMILGVLGFALVFVFILLLLVYIITSIGYSKLYKCYGGWFEENAWMAWVPFASLYIQAKFLQENNNETEAVKWLLTFYWLFGFIPFVGVLGLFVCSIYAIVQWFKYFGNLKVGIGVYILYFLFPIVVPFMLVKHIKRHGIGLNNYNMYSGQNMTYGQYYNMYNPQRNFDNPNMQKDNPNMQNDNTYQNNMQFNNQYKTNMQNGNDYQDIMRNDI